MASEYRKKVIGGPKTYQELNSSRPTKKRVFNYSMPEQDITISQKNSQIIRIKEEKFDLDSREESFGKQDKIGRSKLPLSTKEVRNSRDIQSSPTKQYSKRCDIDQRLTNISSINDKIVGLLSIVRTKREESKQIKPFYQITREKSSKFDSNILKPPLSVHLQSQEDQMSFREQIRSTLREKYNINASQQNQVSSHSFLNSRRKKQEQIMKSDRIDSSDVIQFKGPSKLRENQNDIKVSSFSFRGEKKPLKESEVNVRTQNEEKEKKIIDNLVLDRQIEEIKQKIFENSPFNPKDSLYKECSPRDIDASPTIHEQEETPEILKLVQTLSGIIELDRTMFNYREGFESLRDQKKWGNLTSELHNLDVYIEEKDIRSLVKISIHQKDPFCIGKKQYSLNVIKDLARCISKSHKIWTQEVYQCVSLDSLAKDHFSMNQIDFNSNGTISLEDLVCFINLNSGKFYRSREVAKLFDRFLKIEGKTIDKNLSGGVMYSTFMDKVAK